jgi:hypothetical protein
MQKNIQFVIDAEGHKTAVMLPIEEYEAGSAESRFPETLRFLLTNSRPFTTRQGMKGNRSDKARRRKQDMGTDYTAGLHAHMPQSLWEARLCAAARPVGADRRQLNPTSASLASKFLPGLRAFVYASHQWARRAQKKKG